MKMRAFVARHLLWFAVGALPILAAAEIARGADATALFVEARQASGGKAWDRITNIAGSGTEESSGMVSRWRGVDDLKSPRLMRLVESSIVRYLNIWNGADHWRQRPSGEVHAFNSKFARESSVTDEWLAQRGYLKANAGGALVSAVEQRTDAGSAFDVVGVTPRNGQPVELWFDAKSHLLARSVRQRNLNVELIRYDNYETTDGVTLPHLITEDDGDPSSLDIVRVSSYTFNAASDADFRKPQRPDDATIAGGKTTVPIAFDGDVIVEAKINGRGPFGFILDTGGHDILTPEAAAAIGLKSEGAGTSGGAGEGTVSEKYTRVESMEIGGMTMRDQVFTVIPLQYDTVEQGSRPPLAGILGLEIFERFAVRLDYRAQKLTLEPLKGYVHSGAGTPEPIFFNDDEPLLRAAMDGHGGEFGIDTGNSGSLIVLGHWAEREALTDRLKSGLEVVGFGMGGETHNWATRVALDLAGTSLPHTIARYANDKKGSFSSVVEAGNIGNDVLANFTLDFDYGKGQIWFERSAGFTPSPFSRAGFAASKERNEAFKVVQVSKNTPAADAQIQAGDEIISVDGVPASQMSGWDLRRAMRKAPGTKLSLGIVRTGHRQDATLILRELLP